MDGCRALSRTFHERVARDESLRPPFPNDMHPLIEHFALYLAQEWAGSGDYRAKRGKTSLLCRHAIFQSRKAHPFSGDRQSLQRTRSLVWRE
jgi:truncated hemoglobin YjbI